MERKWIEAQTKYGYSKRLDPMPCGPYIYVAQHESRNFLVNYASMRHTHSTGFELKVGYEIYVAGLDGKPWLVAASYDSGD